MPGPNICVGISAGRNIKSNVATVKVASTGQHVGVGLMAGDEVVLGNETVDTRVSVGGQADGIPRSTPHEVPSATPNTSTPVAMVELAKSTQYLSAGAYGVVAVNHNVSGTCTITANHEAGATGIPVGIVAQNSNVKDQHITTNVKGPVTETERQLYADSLRSKLHDWTGEDYYKVGGKSYGLIISNTFDNRESARTFGDSYTKLIRHGGTQDRTRVKNLLKHLNIKVHDVHENIKSEDLRGILEDFREEVEANEADLIFVVVMSHGGLKRPDTVLMDDLVEVDARKEIIYALGDNDALRKTPKIFLFNMCRDSWEGWVPAADEKSSTLQSDSQSHHFHHSLQDTLLLFTTLPYEVSLRDPYKGATYITEMDRVFRESAHQKMLRKMLYETHMAVLNNHGQTPAVEDILFQDLKFKPRGK